MRGGKGVADTATLCAVLQMNDEREGKGGGGGFGENRVLKDGSKINKCHKWKLTRD